MEIRWVDDYRIQVRNNGKETVISANREGLLSLSQQLKDLAECLPGEHIHYDEFNCLEEGSVDLIIEKTE